VSIAHRASRIAVQVSCIVHHTPPIRTTNQPRERLVVVWVWWERESTNPKKL
jgi:hypothetical protein